MNAPIQAFDDLSNRQVAQVDHAGYVIGEHGKALKITEAMIKNSCLELKARCHLPKALKR